MTACNSSGMNGEIDIIYIVCGHLIIGIATTLWVKYGEHCLLSPNGIDVFILSISTCMNISITVHRWERTVNTKVYYKVF